jgi:hypothetical protein
MVGILFKGLAVLKKDGPACAATTGIQKNY